MRPELLERLSAVTPEEARILAGDSLHRTDYTDRAQFVIDAERLLSPGQLIALRPHTRFTAFPRHTHNYIEIMYQVCGETRHFLNDNEHLTLRAGELLMMNQHSAHAVERAEVGDVAVNMIVQPAFFDSVLPQLDRNNLLSSFLLGGLTNRDEGISCLLFRVSSVIAIQSLMESMIADLLSHRSVSRQLGQTAMTLLFLHLLEHTDLLDAGTAAAPQEHALVAAALREVQEHYLAPNLTAVAKKYGASLSYISRLVHRATGKTFTELVQEKRLMCAAELLATTDMVVADILPLVGYSNSSYFFHLFEKRYAMTPKHYRDSIARH